MRSNLAHCLKIKDENQLDEVITKIQNKLMNARHVTQKNMDFSVSSRKEMQQARADTMNSMNMFLLAIAAVSLIVGAVGIANTMFTSVLEKTKEIGIVCIGYSRSTCRNNSCISGIKA